MQNYKINPQNDYPLATKRPEWIKTPTGKDLEDITLDKVMSGEVTPEDVRISPETLEIQAKIAEAANQKAIARNFRRAGELIAVPDNRILEIYNAMRPGRSTKAELLAIADELKFEYKAEVNALFLKEAADVYEKRGLLRAE